MNILNISKEQHEAIIKIDCGELITLCNTLYHEVQRGTEEPCVYEVYANLMIAKDLSSYGKIADFSIESINEYIAKAKELRNNDK